MTDQNKLAKIVIVPLREVFPREAEDFTRWLGSDEGLELLCDSTGMSLRFVAREIPVGPFAADLLVSSGDDDTVLADVVIENQYGETDHDHLGKVITYLTAIDAKTAIWIVADPRPEHVRAITWLNESSNAAFYLLKVEAVKIEGSKPAPLLTRIVGPSEESRGAGATKKELAERHILREQFWTELLNRAKEKTKLHAAISPSPRSYITAGAGKSGLSFNYVIRKHGPSNVELYIDRGKNSESENKAILKNSRPIVRKLRMNSVAN